MKTELKQPLAKYTGHSATQILGAFEELMDTDASLVYQQLIKKEHDDKKSWEDGLRKRILNKANREPLPVKAAACICHMLWQQVKKLLEKLVEEGRLIRINTYNHRGKLIYKYCTQELLNAYPYLQKNCGNCLWYRKRFKTCAYLRLQQAFNPSKVKIALQSYANGKIRPTATACTNYKPREEFELADGGTQITKTIEELSTDLRVVTPSFITGEETDIVYQCFTCQKPIEEFGIGETILLKRMKVKCPNCSTLYIKNENGKVTIKTEYKHLLRGLYYKENTSLPKPLLEKDPRYAYVIFDSEQLSIDLTNNNDTSIDLIICKQHVPLNKIQYLYFAGKRYKELELFLKALAENEPERYTYTIARAATNDKENKQKVWQGSNELNVDSLDENHYIFLKKLMNRLFEDGLFINDFLHSRVLSNISGMLEIKDIYEFIEGYNWRYEHQLYAMIDVLLRVNGGVKTSYYGSQLEGLSNNYFFEMLKSEGMKVGIWSWGRVNSRFVIDPFLAYSKNSSAYSLYDALLNQLLRSFRAEIDEVFQKVGIEPAKLGPGLFHRRKTKSDIDQLGMYFDLIEPVRVLVLLTMNKAIQEKFLTASDCSFELGERGQEIYRVKSHSLCKFSELVTQALDKEVHYNGKIISFVQAFEHYLYSIRVAIENCYEKEKKQKKLSKREIQQIFSEAQFYPMVYCPVGKEQQLETLVKLAHDGQIYFEGCEAKILEKKKYQEKFTEKAMSLLLLIEPITKEYRITKHHRKEQDRSILIITLMLSIVHQVDFGFNWHSIGYLQKLLGVSQNQIIRIMNQMVNRGFLLETKDHRTKYYQLNLESDGVQQLCFVLDLPLSRVVKDEHKLTKKFFQLFERVTKVYSDLILSTKNQLMNTLWGDWKPPEALQEIASWMIERIAECKNN
ncbi:MAG: hypothetical protein JXA54_06815 [Candidatus Heimdallarchaeota archaeon]|nr:hypothetical protein [Candidatus Heimdallarchaeota archaeon]